MLIDLDTLQSVPKKRYDVCIVGRGVAGITKAFYRRENFDTLLLKGDELEHALKSRNRDKWKNSSHSYLDIGRVKLKNWLMEDDGDFPELPGTMGGPHHMGTTRMSPSPRTGVVDGDLRDFGIDNLYIADSSVFPTFGHANPTVMIVQLSLRLADHLNEKLRKLG